MEVTSDFLYLLEKGVKIYLEGQNRCTAWNWLKIAPPDIPYWSKFSKQNLPKFAQYLEIFVGDFKECIFNRLGAI